MSMITTRREGQILIVTLDRPEQLNALSASACHDLAAIWDVYETDDDLRVAIVTGTGRAFSVGHDLKEDINLPMPDSGWVGLARRHTLDKPLIAAVNGMALGGGFELALACDIIIADEAATFGLPEPLVGLAALGGGVQALVTSMPWHIAMRYLLTSEAMDARTAEKWGLVSEVTPTGRCLDHAMALAHIILRGGPHAIRATKALARHVLEPADKKEAAFAVSMAWFERLQLLDDTREGEAAFREKRKPVWTGR